MPTPSTDRRFFGLQYLGSFAVNAPDQNSKAEQIRKKLEALRKRKFKKKAVRDDLFNVEPYSSCSPPVFFVSPHCTSLDISSGWPLGSPKELTQNKSGFYQGQVSILPRATPAGMRITYGRISGKFNNDYINVGRHICHFMEISIRMEEVSSCSFCIIIDLNGVTNEMVTHFNPLLAKEILSIIQDGYPCRISKMILLNAPHFAELACNYLLKPFLSKKLSERTNGRPKPVLLVVSLSGIKVCSPDGKEVCMAHALRRISYATCEPNHSQFSFLAREPRAHFSHQYCHAFLAKSPEQAEELNSIVGNAFRMAYAAQLQPQLQQVIQRSLEPQTIVWPKAIPGRGMSGICPPSSIPGLKSSGGGGGAPSPTSSDESNSPTELNSCRRLGEKPVLVKRLAMGLGTTPSEEEAPLVHTKHPSFIINTTKTIDLENNRVNESPESKRSSATSTTTSSPPPPPPERTDSLNNRPEDGELKTAPWFQAGIPREITLEVLGQEPVGSFMVRESTSKPGCFALSLRVPLEFQPLGIAHYLILRTNKGFKIKGFTKEFPSLTALITHHSVMPELLPCPLSLARYNPSFDKSDSSRDFADIDTDPDYNTLADFRRMMADLNV